MTGIRTKVSENGRLSLPVELRRQVGLERGGEVVVELDGRDLRIRSLAEVVARAQSLTRRALKTGRAGSLDRFLAGRRAEAERE